MGVCVFIVFARLRDGSPYSRLMHQTRFGSGLFAGRPLLAHSAADTGNERLTVRIPGFVYRETTNIDLRQIRCAQAGLFPKL